MFRHRVWRLFLLAGATVLLIWLRVLHLQVLERDTWVAEAQSKRQRVLKIQPPRGRIVDARGRVLATDAPVYQLALVGWEWLYRARMRCPECGTIHFHSVCTDLRRRKCHCGVPRSRLERLPLAGLGELERLLELPEGTLAQRADERLRAIAQQARELRSSMVGLGSFGFLVDDAVRQFKQDRQHRPFVLVSRIPWEAVRLVEQDEVGCYRGFVVRTALRRENPSGAPAGQLLGYVSAVLDKKELERLQGLHGDNVTYDTRVGRQGLEKAHQSLLLGTVGEEHQARDADGAFTVIVSRDPPERGMDLRLALTAKACAKADEVLEAWGKPAHYFPKTYRASGGFVAMYADTGDIVAWGELPKFVIRDDLGRIFHPSQTEAEFDPSIGEWRLPEGVRLPAGETMDEWRQRLVMPAPLQLSRVSQIAVEPGSTFKIFVGLAMLDGLRLMPEGTLLPFSGRFDCLRRHGMKPRCHAHPAVDLAGAIEVSCNRYFALSLRAFPEHWAIYRRSVPALLDRLGFGRKTGVDVSGEQAGVFLRDWWDFDPRALAHAALSACREAVGPVAPHFVLQVERDVPQRLAGRDPKGRLGALLGAVLEEAVKVAGPGRVALGIRRGEVDRRSVELAFEVLAQPHPEGPRQGAPDLKRLRRMVWRMGSHLVTDVKAGGTMTLGFSLEYHEPIHRESSDPPFVLEDDGFNVAIGQGPVAVTPLQMARAVAVIANGGDVVTPRVATGAGRSVFEPRKRRVALDAAHLRTVRRGMRQVVEGAHSTAQGANWHRVPATVYAKTGTAQTGSWWAPGGRTGKGPWHHWFVGYAEGPPDGRPLVFACVLHSRLEGAASKTATNAVCDFLSWWFTEGPDVR